MEYTELEKKVIAKGIKQFRVELRQASRPMVSVLKKFGLRHDSKLLDEITLSLPYGSDDYDRGAVNIPNDAGLESLKSKILELFLNEVSDIKDRIDNLDI